MDQVALNDSGRVDPELDVLTGLASRRSFTRTVGQLDADRELVAVVVVSITNIAELNLTCGWDAGDELLSRLGAALNEQRSVDITVGRLGGNRFGLLRAPAGHVDLDSWSQTVVSALQQTIDRWRDRLDDFDQAPLAPLNVVAGAACATAGTAWSNAELALDSYEHGGTDLVLYDRNDPLIAERRRSLRIAEEVASALRNGRLVTTSVPVVSLDPGSSDSWMRLDVDAGVEARALDSSSSSSPIDAAVGLHSELGQALDRWLLGQFISRQQVDPSNRFVVPLRALPLDRRSLSDLEGLLEQLHPHPGVSGFEISQERLRLMAERKLVKRFATILRTGRLSLTVSDYDGSWSIQSLFEALPVVAVQPSVALVRAADEPGSPATRILSTVVENATKTGRAIIGPAQP